MSEFVFLFRTGLAESELAMGTPERAAKSLQVWLAWLRELESGGHLKAPGQPLATTGKVVRGPSGVITDGPFAEAKDLVLGFIVVEARDIDEAAELAKGCPIARGGGSVEVRPVGMAPNPSVRDGGAAS
ncbi:MAG: YciI family protein [Polyangiaceae bacterium]